MDQVLYWLVLRAQTGIRAWRFVLFATLRFNRQINRLCAGSHLQKFPGFHDRLKPTIERLVGVDLKKIAAVDEPNFARVIHFFVVPKKLGPLCSGYDDRLWLFHHAGGLVDLEHLCIDQLLPGGLYENLEAVSSVRIFKSDCAHAAAF